MEDYLIIDGYNIINDWPELNELKKESYAHAREKLIEILADFKGLIDTKIILVFDAYQVKEGVRSNEEINGVVVVFTREGETADMFIEKLVGQFPENFIIGVATSDWAEQQTILSKGAHRLSAKELRLRIRNAKLSRGEYINKKENDPFSLDNQLKNQTRDILEKWRRKKQ